MHDGTAHAHAFRARADRAASAEIASLVEQAADAHAESCKRGDPEDTRERAELAKTLRAGSVLAASIARRSGGWEAPPEPMVPRRPLPPGAYEIPHKAVSIARASDHPLGTSAIGATRDP